MKLPIKAITDFARSPKGQKAIRDARQRYDTPENRKRVTDLVQRRRGGGGPNR